MANSVSFKANYEREIYENKISQLEQCYNDLDVELDELIRLREGMYTFWEDEVAQKTALVLLEEISKVRAAMEDTKESIFNYKTIVERMGSQAQASADAVDAILENVSKPIGSVLDMINMGD